MLLAGVDPEAGRENRGFARFAGLGFANKRFQSPRHLLTTLLLLLLGALWAAVFWRNAWICDDAYITFRSVEQLVHGHGPRWNLDERVQAFTHPLWFGILSLFRLASPAVAWNALILSFVLSSAALILLARRKANATGAAVLMIAVALSSKAFVDFSASGLETPLVFFLLALFFTVLFRDSAEFSVAELRLLVFIGSLLLLCRHDLLLIVAPAIAAVAYRARGEGWPRIFKAFVVGSSPFLLWTLFSLIYFGFPFPNTAYAKLNTGIAAHALWRQGQFYLLNAVRWDPVTVAVSAFGIFVLVRDRRLVRVGAGVGLILYVLYVVKVGGDFMAGRFLAPVFFASLAVVLPRLAALPRPHQAGLLLVLAAIHGVLPGARSRTSSQDPLVSYLAVAPHEHGIADEKKIYTGRSAFNRFERQAQASMWRKNEGAVMVQTAIGWTGFNAPLETKVIDVYGLADPLLARLPCNSGWRVGHYARSLPGGYRESVESGANKIENPSINHLYGQIQKVTQGPLFSLDRWRAILYLNLKYRRPACPAPPCRAVSTKVLPPSSREPGLPLGPGTMEAILHTGNEVMVKGWLPVLDETQVQELLVLVAEKPNHTALTKVWRNDLGEYLPPHSSPLAGFELTLDFDTSASAEKAAESLCLASGNGSDWALVPTPGERCQELLRGTD